MTQINPRSCGAEAATFIVLTIGTFAGRSRFLDSHRATHDDQDHRYAEAHAGAEELNDVRPERGGLTPDW